MKDRFDLPVSAGSAEALDDYVAAVDLLLSANPGAEERLGHAIAADPDFALAHIARARLFQLQARMPEARNAATRAKSLREREQRHIDAIALTVEGSEERRWRWSANTSWNTPGRRCRCLWRSASLGCSVSAGGAIITRRNWRRFRNSRRIGVMISGFSAI
jgi:hypothetical protein